MVSRNGICVTMIVKTSAGISGPRRRQRSPRDIVWAGATRASVEWAGGAVALMVAPGVRCCWVLRGTRPPRGVGGRAVPGAGRAYEPTRLAPERGGYW